MDILLLHTSLFHTYAKINEHGTPQVHYIYIYQYIHNILIYKENMATSMPSSKATLINSQHP